MDTTFSILLITPYNKILQQTVFFIIFFQRYLKECSAHMKGHIHSKQLLSSNKNKTTTNLQIISDSKPHLLLDEEYVHQAQANTSTAIVTSGWLPNPLYSHFILVMLQEQVFCFLGMHYVFSSLSRFISVLANKSKFPSELLLLNKN